MCYFFLLFIEGGIGRTVLLIFFFEHVVGSDDAFGDLLKVAFLLFGLDVVGVEFLDLIEIGAVQVLISEGAGSVLWDA